MSYLIIALIGGFVCGAIAPARRRSVLGWFVVGFCAPVVGVILLMVLEPKPDPFLEATFPDVPEQGPAQFAQQAAAQRQAAQRQAIDSLHKLVELKDRGALTETEFEETKQQLLQNV